MRNETPATDAPIPHQRASARDVARTPATGFEVAVPLGTNSFAGKHPSVDLRDAIDGVGLGGTLVRTQTHDTRDARVRSHLRVVSLRRMMSNAISTAILGSTSFSCRLSPSRSYATRASSGGSWFTSNHADISGKETQAAVYAATAPVRNAAPMPR